MFREGSVCGDRDRVRVVAEIIFARDLSIEAGPRGFRLAQYRVRAETGFLCAAVWKRPGMRGLRIRRLICRRFVFHDHGLEIFCFIGLFNIRAL